MPIANAIPASDITLIDNPKPEIATNVPTTDIGIAIKITKVGNNERRNKSNIPSARMPPIQIFCCTSSIAERI